MPSVSEKVRNLLRSAVVPGLMLRERMESGVSYNLLSRETRTNPYDLYDELRSKDPVHRMRLLDAWLLTRYEDVDAVLRDHRRFSNAERNFVEAGRVTLLDLDPPDHTRLRSLVSRAFTPRAVSALEPRSRQIAEGLLDQVEGRDRFDLIEALAFPMTVTVIAEMIGVPPEDMEQFKAWSNDIAVSVEPVISDEQVRRVDRATEELYEYFDGIIALHRSDPRDDLLSALLAAEEEGERLTREELLATLLLLLVAGNETTRNLIGNGMLALLRNPDQLSLLRDRPDLMDTAIDEFLRYDSPVQIDGRYVREDLEIGGKKIRAGQRVISAIGAANRDPEAFTSPGSLDIGRREKSHISFGRGIHHCLGAPLALLEGRTAFTALLERFSSFRLLAEPEFRDQVVLRGVNELWIEVERSPSPEDGLPLAHGRLAGDI